MTKGLRLEDEPLNVIGRELGLNRVELGDLFGVSRQAVSGWIDEGIPPSRLPDVSRILRVVSVLTRKLKPGRTALVARRPAADFGGRTLLDALHDDPDKTLALVEESLDWSGTA